MSFVKKESYVGGEKWQFSDKIYYRLTQTKINSSFNPTCPVSLTEFPELISDKKTFGLVWETPTFKDIDCNYLFHVYDKSKIDLVISTSSGNTVEGVARVIKNYNQTTKKHIRGILIVPELSSYKVSRNIIDDNPYVTYIVLKNSTLDGTREFASKLKNSLLKSASYSIAMASEDLKTSAYAQLGLVLADLNLMDANTCYVQTVSGGVGPAGVIEAAYELNKRPELMVVQPENGSPGPIVDALNEHQNGGDPFSKLQEGKYRPPTLEPTLGSTKPLYTLKKFVNWRKSGGTILTSSITRDYLFQHKEAILNLLVQANIYPDYGVASKFFDIEKSGCIAIAAVLHDVRKIDAQNIVINFTGRRPGPLSDDLVMAIPHLSFDPISEDVGKIAKYITDS